MHTHIQLSALAARTRDPSLPCAHYSLHPTPCPTDSGHIPRTPLPQLCDLLPYACTMGILRQVDDVLLNIESALMLREVAPWLSTSMDPVDYDSDDDGVSDDASSSGGGAGAGAALEWQPVGHGDATGGGPGAWPTQQQQPHQQPHQQQQHSPFKFDAPALTGPGAVFAGSSPASPPQAPSRRGPWGGPAASATGQLGSTAVAASAGGVTRVTGTDPAQHFQ
jgi:hypothetical protein